MRATPDGNAQADQTVRPWRAGLLQAVRERVENDAYEVHPDAVAESIIEHSLDCSARRDQIS
jgi:hypothetical protein